MTRVKTNKSRPRTYARNRAAAAISRRGKLLIAEPDSTYFLKLVVVIILGSFWIKFAAPMTWLGVPVNGLPVGLLLGLVGIRLFEQNQFDRKIWYPVLVVVAIVSFFLPSGIVL